MKRSSKKKTSLFQSTNQQSFEDFKKNAQKIIFNQNVYEKQLIDKESDLLIDTDKNVITWLNIYGLNYAISFQEIINQNKLDDFLLNLISEPNHRTKLVELEKCFFLSIKSIVYSDKEEIEIDLEQIMFVISPYFVWSIQEKDGDYFEHIRVRIRDNKGIVRKKRSDYLLFLMLESIIDSYYQTKDKLTNRIDQLFLTDMEDRTTEFLNKIEHQRKVLLQLKKAIGSLKEALGQFDKLEELTFVDLNTKYFQELKEQTSYLIDNIDYDIQRLEGLTNLFFSLQNNRLNEVMKTLAIISVIFSPLSFIAGLYGMNFKNIPELNTEYGYFIVLGVMFLLVFLVIVYLRRKRWLSN